MVHENSLANLKPKPITKENAKTMQKKSAKSRKENRTVREILKEKLSQGTRKGDMIESILAKAEKGDLQAYDRVIRDLREEDGAPVGENALRLVVSRETAEILKSL